MPLYEYQCDACGHRFEVIQKMSDQPIERCPKCGAIVRKLQSAPSFQFKGTGWYVTDYARKDTGEASSKGEGEAKQDAKADSKSADSTSDSKSESKTESKADGKSGATESSSKSAKADTASKPAASSGSSASSGSTSKD
jgi:putative FmdB family regulatory protein